MFKAAIFKYKSKLPEILFKEVLNYFVYSYRQMLNDKEQYSKQDCEVKTTFKFEDYLKWNFVKKYLQNEQNKIKSGIKEIAYLSFQFETEKEYIQDETIKTDKIDIFISNLGLNTSWNNEVKEDHYFAFECKRLKNTRKNNEYITDIEKFVQRDYWQTGFRFPFNGLIGFVEKSTTLLEKIINDIDIKLKNHNKIKSFKNKGIILDKYPIYDFDRCHLSKHRHNSVSIIIEVYHLFFDYSSIIVD